MVPLPRFATWDDFNAWLEEQCRKRHANVLRGHSETIGERLQRDLEAMAPLPAPWTRQRAGGLGAARRVPGSAPADGGAAAQGRPPRVRAGVAAPGDLRSRRAASGGEDCAQDGRRRLRRHQASGPVPGREAATEARPRHLPLPAARQGRDHLGGELHVSDGRLPRHERGAEAAARPSPQDAEAADLPPRLRQTRPPGGIRRQDRDLRASARGAPPRVRTMCSSSPGWSSSS